MSDGDNTADKPADGFDWGIVEIFGHRRHAGRIREEEKFGSKMLRIDVPIDGDPEKGWITHFYGGASIFSFSLSDEVTVMAANKPYVSPYRRLTAAVIAEDVLDPGLEAERADDRREAAETDDEFDV